MDGLVAPHGAGAGAVNARRGHAVCRACGHEGLLPFVNLGLSPLCESFIPPEAANRGEAFYPLDVRVCPACWLAQLGEYVPVQDIFTEYAYFSSYSKSWLQHAADYVEAMAGRLGLGPQSFVVEVASNDGYLLRNVVARGIPCLGIEPAANVAQEAEAAGVPTWVRFFGRGVAAELAAQDRRADLVAANNILAQVPDLDDFVGGLALLLKPEGVLTLEFPHLLRLLAGNQFDTIYHEHFGYFSLGTVQRLLARHGLRAFDVEELWTHGGSLRVLACRAEAAWAETPAVARVLRDEADAGLDRAETYAAFGARVEETRYRLLELLIGLKRAGKRVAGYGAPGKGNTLLNYCGIRDDLLAFTADRNPYKHGRLLPGTRIQIHPPDKIREERPDAILILPWNLKEEIMAQLDYVREWGCRFIIPIPRPEIVDPDAAQAGA